MPKRSSGERIRFDLHYRDGEQSDAARTGKPLETPEIRRPSRSVVLIISDPTSISIEPSIIGGVRLVAFAHIISAAEAK